MLGLKPDNEVLWLQDSEACKVGTVFTASCYQEVLKVDIAYITKVGIGLVWIYLSSLIG